MPRVDVVLESKIERTARVMQAEGIFDVPATEKNRVEFHFDAPLEERAWQVGLIVGPSGAGKTSIARHLFGEHIVEGFDWHPTRAIVDGFGDRPIKDITAALNSVGFSSPPSWLRPFQVLSNGEKFRATMARALLDDRDLIVIDEFTSVVDRQVAKVASTALQKAVRARPSKKLVAVACHYDITEWLQPDWILEPHAASFAWRSVQPRPRVQLEVVRADHSAWRWFARHHYLSADLHRAARCFVGLVNGELAAFGALLHFPHPKATNITSLSRVVVLPDYQGLGLGAYSFTEALGRIAHENGRRFRVGTSHPALFKPWAKSPKWRMERPPDLANKAGPNGGTSFQRARATRRRVAHFEWVGGGFAEGRERRTARAMWEATC